MELKLVALSLHKYQHKLSNRLRCHIRVSSGASSWAKVAWDSLAIDEGCLDAPIDASVYKSTQEFVEGLTLKCEGGPSDVEQLYQFLATTKHEKGSDIGKFTTYINSIDEEEDQNLCSLQSKLKAAMYRAVSLILDEYGFFSDDWQDTLKIDGAEGGQDADCFRLLSWAVQTILKSETSGNARAVLRETLQRSNLAVSIAEAKDEAVGKPVDAIVAVWSELWEAELAIQCAPTITVTDATSKSLATLQKFNGLMSTSSVSSTIEKVVTRITCSDDDEQATTGFLQAAAQLSGVLPRCVAPHIDAAKAYKQIKLAVSGLGDGKSLGVVQATNMLRSYKKIVDPLAKKPGVTKWQDILTEEWNTCFTDLLKKV